MECGGIWRKRRVLSSASWKTRTRVPLLGPPTFAMICGSATSVATCRHQPRQTRRVSQVAADRDESKEPQTCTCGGPVGGRIGGRGHAARSACCGAVGVASSLCKSCAPCGPYEAHIQCDARADACLEPITSCGDPTTISSLCMCFSATRREFVLGASQIEEVSGGVLGKKETNVLLRGGKVKPPRRPDLGKLQLRSDLCDGTPEQRAVPAALSSGRGTRVPDRPEIGHVNQRVRERRRCAFSHLRQDEGGAKKFGQEF